jgi:hypothetical protein
MYTTTFNNRKARAWRREKGTSSGEPMYGDPRKGIKERTNSRWDCFTGCGVMVMNKGRGRCPISKRERKKKRRI